MNARFAIVVCQHGAEATLKDTLDQDPDEPTPARTQKPATDRWRLAFSRPGCITLKREGNPGKLPEHPLIRAASWSLGRVVGADLGEQLAALEPILAAQRSQPPIPSDAETRPPRTHLHVWQRDAGTVGHHGFEPFVTPLANAIASEISRYYAIRGTELVVNQAAGRGDRVLDVVCVEPNEWLVGWHEVRTIAQGWVGGVPPLEPTDVVSRAYYKIAEAIRWSGLPVRAGDRCVELGSSPGGACQYLLEQGLSVRGVDPAEMDPRIMEHPKFEHFRARGGDLKRGVYANAKWLFVDSNVSPEKSLATIGNIVQHPKVKIRGWIAQLKLSDYAMIEFLPEWIAKVKSWGYTEVKVRQLAFNRRELTLAARWPKKIKPIPVDPVGE
jgi:23S rRNA (cytidine2498-2'-O)-methyltransferase